MTAFVLQRHILVMHDIIGPILESADNGLKCKYQLKFRSYVYINNKNLEQIKCLNQNNILRSSLHLSEKKKCSD